MTPNDRGLAVLSRLCGEPILRTETRRLAVELDHSRRFALNNDPPDFSFAVGESGQLYHLDLEEDGPDPGKPSVELRFRASRRVAEASEDAQRAAGCLGHKLPKKQEEEEI